MQVFDWFGKWGIYSKDKTAFKEFETGRTFTYKKVNVLASALSKYFKDNMNLKKGDRVSVLAENSIEYIILFGVAQKLGITLVPLNYRLTSSELDFIISDAGCMLIISEEKFANKITTLDCYQNIKFKLLLEELKSILAGFESEEFDGEFNNDNQTEEITEDDAAFILYTSGTTAFPKGAVYTHKMLFYNSINTELRLDLTSSDRSINSAPSFHTGSWNVLMTPFIHHGAFTLLMKSFNPELMLKALDEEKITIWWAVPTMLKMMSDSEMFEKVELKNLRYLVVGGEAMPIDLIEKWHSKGVLIRQGYGLTEVGPNVTSLNHQDAIRKQGSIGTPNFYYNTKIVDADEKEIVNEGVGELALKGPTVTPGYWKNDVATKESIKNGWFFTGDIVRRDKEGFLFVVDRIKNMYISGGENVYPAEVEHVLLNHPKIKDAAIIGIPDEKWGETGKAFIVKNELSDLKEEDIINYCVERLAKYKVPKHIRFLTSLPTNDAGKIDRKKLKEL
ncbi:MAG: AMP-binding protein [Bacteroidetes bacterium]|nr:AMP-binding protein [Bacteroidota bacterium]